MQATLASLILISIYTTFSYRVDAMCLCTVDGITFLPCSQCAEISNPPSNPFGWNVIKRERHERIGGRCLPGPYLPPRSINTFLCNEREMCQPDGTCTKNEE